MLKLSFFPTREPEESKYVKLLINFKVLLREIAAQRVGPWLILSAESRTQIIIKIVNSTFWVSANISL